MTELPPARFRKTKTDKWAVMAPVETLREALAGDGKVEVLKKSGDTTTFTVASLGKAFDVDGVQMCYGYAPGDDDSGAGSPESAGASIGSVAEPPPRDASEPLPEYRGEDVWDEF